MAGPIIGERVAVCIAPVLPADVRQYALALAEASLLRTVVGGLAYHDRSPIAAGLRLVDRAFGTHWYAKSEARRVGSELPRSAFHPHLWAEVASRVPLKLRLRRPGPLTADLTPAAVDRAAAKLIRPSDRLVLGREDGCLHSFQMAKRVGAITLYDLPIAYHTALHRILASEAEAFPNAARQFAAREEAHPERSARKSSELSAADHVLVASQFVRVGVMDAGVPCNRVTAIPYGCEPAREYLPYRDRMPTVLYVGHVSLRKGVLRLLKAWKRLGAFRTHTLKLIGKMKLPPAALGEYSGTYEYISAIPRSQLWDHYAQAQAFVFPSACDGFGLVLNEALSCGTPVVASSNTGAPGFISEGVHGFTYPHGDDDRLAAHIDWMLSHPNEVADMSRAAYELAQSWGWPEYRAAIRELVFKLLAGNSSLGGKDI